MNKNNILSLVISSLSFLGTSTIAIFAFLNNMFPFGVIVTLVSLFLTVFLVHDIKRIRSGDN